MNYDKEFWNKYADENESRNNEEFTKFLTDLARSLHCTSILEIGCGTGVDLRKFDDSFQIHGVDLNEHALELARKNIPKGEFYKENNTVSSNCNVGRMILKNRVRKLVNYLHSGQGVRTLYRPLPLENEVLEYRMF